MDNADYVHETKSLFEALTKSDKLVIQLIFVQNETLTSTQVLDSMAVAFLQDLTHAVVSEFDLFDGKLTLQRSNEPTETVYAVALRAKDISKHLTSVNWLYKLQAPEVLARIGCASKAFRYFSRLVKVFKPSFPDIQCRLNNGVVDRSPRRKRFNNRGYLYKMDRIYGGYDKLGYELDMRISVIRFRSDKACEVALVSVTKDYTYLWSARKIKSSRVQLVHRPRQPPELVQCQNQSWFYLIGSDETDMYVSKGESIAVIMNTILNRHTRYHCIQSMCCDDQAGVKQVCKARFNHTKLVTTMNVKDLQTCIEWQNMMSLTGTAVVPYHIGDEYDTLTLDQVIMLVSRTMLRNSYIEDGLVEALRRSLNNLRYTP